jgi:hypothetical protein
LIRTLARAHRWKRMLQERKYPSTGEIVEAEGITRSFVNRLLRLTLLAPDIQEAILDGRQAKGTQLEELTEWDGQGGQWLLTWAQGRDRRQTEMPSGAWARGRVEPEAAVNRAPPMSLPSPRRTA